MRPRIITRPSHSSLIPIEEKRDIKAGIIIVTEVDKKTETGQVVETDLEGHCTEANLSLDKTLWEGISEEKAGDILGTTTDLTGVEVSQIMGSFQESLGEITRVSACQIQVQEQVQIERIKCFKCREYDYFTNDCSNMKATDIGQPEQMQ